MAYRTRTLRVVQALTILLLAAFILLGVKGWVWSGSAERQEPEGVTTTTASFGGEIVETTLESFLKLTLPDGSSLNLPFEGDPPGPGEVTLYWVKSPLGEVASPANDVVFDSASGISYSSEPFAAGLVDPARDIWSISSITMLLGLAALLFASAVEVLLSARGSDRFPNLSDATFTQEFRRGMIPRLFDDAFGNVLVAVAAFTAPLPGLFLMRILELPGTPFHWGRFGVLTFSAALGLMLLALVVRTPLKALTSALTALARRPEPENVNASKFATLKERPVWVQDWISEQEVDEETFESLLKDFEGSLGDLVKVARELGPDPL